jgi:hypothetical protein
MAAPSDTQASHFQKWQLGAADVAPFGLGDSIPTDQSNCFPVSLARFRLQFLRPQKPRIGDNRESDSPIRYQAENRNSYFRKLDIQ